MVVESVVLLLIDESSLCVESNGRASIGLRLFHISLAMIELSHTNITIKGANIKWNTTV